MEDKHIGSDVTEADTRLDNTTIIHEKICESDVGSEDRNSRLHLPCDVIPPGTNDISLRRQSFNWEKPPEMSYQDLTASAKLAVALTLEDDLRERDLVIRLLTKQLRRSHAEKNKMAEQLDGYKGDDRDTLFAENCNLRHQISRVTRENLSLQARALQHQWSNSRKSTNSSRETGCRKGKKGWHSNSLGSRTNRKN